MKRIEECHAVFFTGGDQTRLTTKLNDTNVLKTIKEKYNADENFIVAGTSAGAMAIASTMITGGSISKTLLKGAVKINKGFGLNSDIIIDTHFKERDRFARLAQAVTLNPSLLGIGLGEDSALTILNGNAAECCGTGMVIIINGNKISKTNINSVDETTPIIVNDLNVHILAKGSKFNIKEREFK